MNNNNPFHNNHPTYSPSTTAPTTPAMMSSSSNNVYSGQQQAPVPTFEEQVKELRRVVINNPLAKNNGRACWIGRYLDGDDFFWWEDTQKPPVRPEGHPPRVKYYQCKKPTSQFYNHYYWSAILPSGEKWFHWL
jgi:hypothetical protein